MNDSISRQAAIEIAEKAFIRGLLATPDLRRLPATQPEIVRCKDCKHYVEYHKLCKGMDQYTCHMNPDDFCSYGERKE